MNSKFFIRCFLVVVSILLLSSCGSKEISDVSQPTNPDDSKTDSTTLSVATPSLETLANVKALEEDQQWQEAFNAWKEIALKSNAKDQAQYANNAALMLFHYEQLDIIPSFYESLDYEFTTQTNTNKNVLLAASYFNNGKTYQSLSTLPDISTISEQSFLVIALNTKAQAILNIGKPLESAKLRIQLYDSLFDQGAINQNFVALWDAFERLSENRILKTLKAPQDARLRGWLELSLIARRSNMLPTKMEPWIAQWHTVYAEHQASSFADKLLEQSQNIYISPTKIALMLPLEGKLSKVARAIQDGFLYAYYQSNNEHKADIEIITVDPALDFKGQYDLAIQQGADFIVGPLNKDAVSDLAVTQDNTVPTLALNYSNDDNNSPNLFQYGLRPEDEADQVADYALLDRNYNAATLMPDTAWGERLNSAFKERYERLGGTIYSEAQYPSKSNDYGLAIKNLLNLTQSKSRHRMIQTVIGEKAEFQPRRRQDIDMIFIGANARQARIIKPQLKFHYAQDIQVYATSHIANSNAKKSADRDRDLNGVYYVDMPWTLRSQALTETKDIQNYWPTLNKSYGRLFAMGIDAYHLIPQLKRLQFNQDEFFQGLTGKLTVDDQGHIHRELLLATYKKGKQLEITAEVSE